MRKVERRCIYKVEQKNLRQIVKKGQTGRLVRQQYTHEYGANNHERGHQITFCLLEHLGWVVKQSVHTGSSSLSTND